MEENRKDWKGKEESKDGWIDEARQDKRKRRKKRRKSFYLCEIFKYFCERACKDRTKQKFREKKEGSEDGWIDEGRKDEREDRKEGNPFTFAKYFCEQACRKVPSITGRRSTPGFQLLQPQKIHANPGEQNRYPGGTIGQE